MAKDPMTASDGLKALPNLVAELREKLAVIEQECSAAQYKWIGLGKVGGQRQDSAAEFLKSVRREVNDLAKFVSRVDREMVAVIADPWGDERTEEQRKADLLKRENLVIL